MVTKIKYLYNDDRNTYIDICRRCKFSQLFARGFSRMRSLISPNKFFRSVLYLNLYFDTAVSKGYHKSNC